MKIFSCSFMLIFLDPYYFCCSSLSFQVTSIIPLTDWIYKYTVVWPHTESRVQTPCNAKPEPLQPSPQTGQDLFDNPQLPHVSSPFQFRINQRNSNILQTIARMPHFSLAHPQFPQANHLQSEPTRDLPFFPLDLPAFDSMPNANDGGGLPCDSSLNENFHLFSFEWSCTSTA